MKLSRLLQRELGIVPQEASVTALYGDKGWVDELDIVNELGGHSGCVNTLCWSRSGRLLASGSDDQHLNIHSHQPESTIAPFSLTTSISTGHTANIFSTKFMPHSNDQTLVSCAGDGEVRVFDVERSARSTIPVDVATERRRGNNSTFNGVRYLGEADTNCRVYRSHSDRVKRIVTESSPYLFLTCSEDGEVRQWDLRQPSSAYPPPRGGRGFMARGGDHDDTNVPPPLISYKRYRLDLNTISCSASQPHYIALGGAHLHCFLHDRRMLGRDRTLERGTPSAARAPHEDDESLTGQATQCVRRFAPNGATRMKRTDNNHITACKISDANPNEIVVSWSGDWIYTFDLVKSPDAREDSEPSAESLTSGLAKTRGNEARDRKRKRGQAASSESPEQGRGGPDSSQPVGATVKDDEDIEKEEEEEELALRVRYANGQSEEIPIEPTRPATTAVDRRHSTPTSRETGRHDAITRSRRIAHSIVSIRREMFRLVSSQHATEEASFSDAIVRSRASMNNVLSHAATCIQTMDEIMRTWRYPVNPSEEEVIVQQTLRKNRDSTRRFVQAAGTLARVLGGQLRTAGVGESPILQYFQQLTHHSNTSQPLPERVEFCYDFARAILSWLDGGRESLLHCFTQTPDRRRDSLRWPIREHQGPDAIEEILIPHLFRRAGTRSIPDVDASRFEFDEYQISFETETAAVIAFGDAVRHPFRATTPSSADEDEAPLESQDRRVCLRFWALKVARGLLRNAAEGVNFGFVEKAFGGVHAGEWDDSTSSSSTSLHDDDDPVEATSDTDYHPSPTPMVSYTGPATSGSASESPPAYATRAMTVEEALSDDDMMLLDDFRDDLADQLDARSGHAGEDENEDEASDGDDVEDDDDDDEVADDDDDDDGMTAEERRFMWASAFDRSRMRKRVEQHVPCSSHTRQYRGHCNVKTVKDVNFYGLNDEYVVSGSDSGHVFIWDKKTSELLNILEGDGEVVNVIQGHPYEPMMAVSGIDHTIKIFSPDQRAQDDARNGVNLANTTSTGYSSLELGGRVRFGRRQPVHDEDAGRDEIGSDGDGDANEDRQVAANGLRSRKRMHRSYEITSQNDVERQGGMRDAYITVRRDLLPHVNRIGVDFAEWLGWFG